MRQEPRRFWVGMSAARKRAIILIGLLLIASIFILRYNLANRGAEENVFENCAREAAFRNGGNSTIYDDFMDVKDTKCNRIIEVNQETLEEQKNCSPDPLNFFLLWSTKREDWMLKHYRVVDSIFKFHPDARLHIFSKSLSIADFKFYTDQSFDIVHHELEPEKIFKDTPLDRWAQKIDEWKKSSNYFSHVTDAMRIALLWKYGGVYLDTDAPVIRSLKNVRNAVGVQHPTSVYKGGEINGAVLVFDRMHPFLYYAMHDLMTTYDPNAWDVAGPRVMTRCVNEWSNLHPFMVRWIPVHKAGQIPLPNEPLGTPAITVFTDRYAFYPHPWWQTPRIDTKPEDAEVKQFRRDVEERAYAYHYVNQMVRGSGAKIRKGIYLFEVLNRACLFECSYDDLDISIVDVIDRKNSK